MSTAIIRERNAVRLDGIPGFSPGEYASSLHGAQARILQSLGEALTYEDLICFGAFAFRVEVAEDMCPSAGHPCCGFRCIDNSTRALPWVTREYDLFRCNTDDERAAVQAEACAAIKDSIDRGVPVQYGCEEDGLIIGYADDGRRWQCVHPYHEWGGAAFWHDEVTGFPGGRWPWGISVWLAPKPDGRRAPRRDLLVAGLRQAVEMWHAEKRESYLVGEAAYAHWLDWLRDVDAGMASAPRTGVQGNGWCFDVLVHCRRIAGGWLRRHAETIGAPQAADCLRTAADQYAQLAAACMHDLECPWNLAVGPDRAWTAEMRQEQIARLEVARAHDRAAIAAIELAIPCR